MSGIPDALAVVCPECGAQPGEPCERARRAAGKPASERLHRLRWTAYWDGRRGRIAPGTWDRDSSTRSRTAKATAKLQGAEPRRLLRRNAAEERETDRMLGVGIPTFDVRAGIGEAASYLGRR